MKRFVHSIAWLLIGVLVAGPAMTAVGAIGTAISVSTSNPLGIHSMVPVSLMGNWQTVATAITTADNGGTNPVLVVYGSAFTSGTGIQLTRSTTIPINVQGTGTTVQVRAKYTTGGTVTTAPIIQVFGLDGNGKPERLFTSGASPSAFVTCTADATNDVQDGTNSYTTSQSLDCNGASQIVVGIQVAGSAGYVAIEARTL